MAKNENQFGTFIRLLRKSHNPPYTQRDLAAELTKRGYYTAASAIAHWENNIQRAKPDNLKDQEYVRVLASILDTDPYMLYRAAGYLEGLDMPGSDDVEFFHFLDKLTPEQRQKALDVIKVMFA